MTVNRTALITSASALMMLTACGDKTPVPETTPPSTPPTTTATTVTRPSTIELTTFDPCTWFTPKEHPEFKINVAARPYNLESVLRVKQCVWNINGADYRVGASTTKGIDFWFSEEAAWQATKGTVLGFPAVRALHDIAKGHCEVAVDISPGQQVIASTDITIGAEHEFPDPCVTSETMAESAMRALGAK